MSKKAQLAELAGSNEVRGKKSSKRIASQKKVTQHKPVKRPPVPTAYEDEGKSLDDMLGDAQTRHITSSEDSAFYLLRQISQDRGFGDYVDYPTLTKSITEMAKQVHNGDLRQMETMLVASAKCLEILSHSMMGRAFRFDMLCHTEAFLKLSLKAQNQMRHTIETLGKLKNPPVVIAKQANLATNQQVNNHSRDEKIIVPNELSAGVQHELCQNSGTPSDAVRDDSSVEAVAEVHRCKDRRGQA